MYDGIMTARARLPVDVLYLIAAFKFIKALLLLAVAFGVLRLLHRDAAQEVYRWAQTFRVDPNNRYVHRLLERFFLLNAKQLRELSVGTFFYAAIFFTEGIGLSLRRRWAEYFTILVTCSFIPLEMFEFARRATWPRGLVLALNIGAVIYLVFDLRRGRVSRVPAEMDAGGSRAEGLREK
jgi:uncharacterized membrane protein (DUF2068 family)